MRGNVYIQDGIEGDLYSVYDKINMERRQWNGVSIVGRDTGAIDPQLSPDGTKVAFVVAGDIYVVFIDKRGPPIQITFGARHDDVAITHGLADFVAQEEMDRYRGFWWQQDSSTILFAKVDETHVPPYRITHQGKDGSAEESYEDHRYPFAGQDNPRVQLGHVRIHDTNEDQADQVHHEEWSRAVWFTPPREATEYLARVAWLPDGTACAQWQNRTQTTLVLQQMDPSTGKTKTLLTERSDVWINLHHMFHTLPRAVHPDECCETKNGPFLPTPLPDGSFSFLFASERSGYCHLYLYTHVPGIHGAVLVRTLTAGDWVVESIAGVDMDNDVVYITGTYDSPLQRHLYAIPIINRMSEDVQDVVMDDVNSPNSGGTNGSGGVRRGFKSVMSALSGAAKPRLRRSESSNMSGTSEYEDSVEPIRLTADGGMHNIVMDSDCRMFVDTSSDLGRPTSVRLYKVAEGGPFSNRTDSNNLVRLVFCLYDAAQDDKAMTSLLGSLDMASPGSDRMLNLPAPEILSFPTSDGTETLHAALYKPDPRVHGPGPYPLICAVYGGPHVQRVNRSWSQCADMRAQRLRSLGFAVVKCDNRGSSRRGLAFESAIRGRLGRLEVLDQVTTVRQLTMRGIADPSRVGIYGWSYGGYLSAMCLCRAPDIFHVAIAGAPVTSWDGYDTHYTERYMGLPAENANGYRESAVFDHVPNMRGNLMIVHGLIDENVHFRHTARLINRLIANGKDYDLLIFPDERHSPRRLRDRIYMEQRISDYLTRHLGPMETATQLTPRPNNNPSSAIANVRSMAGHL
jgi:dipeptidyl-peptidase-4